MIQDKEDNFFSSIISNINSFNINGFKVLLNSLDNEEGNLFYNGNKYRIDEYFNSKFTIKYLVIISIILKK